MVFEFPEELGNSYSFRCIQSTNIIIQKTKRTIPSSKNRPIQTK